ncbi:MAG: hypothetical protein ACE5JA_01525 [bacterium]
MKRITINPYVLTVYLETFFSAPQPGEEEETEKSGSSKEKLEQPASN